MVFDVSAYDVAISSEPAWIVTEFVDHAVVDGPEPFGPSVVSTGLDVATPVNDVPPIIRAIAEPDSVAVMTVLDANPDGACALTSAALELAGFAALPCLSIVHVRPPPDTDDRFTVLNQPSDNTMNPPDATAAEVVSEIELELGSAVDVPRLA